jgi:hypothetical protein
MFHVSPAANRSSIREHGLDWRRMTGRGIAGSRTAEAEGVFVCLDEFDARFFVWSDSVPVDIWTFDGDETQLVRVDSGYSYLPGVVAPERLTLLRTDLVRPPAEPSDGGGAYRSTLTITYADPDD